MILLLLLLYCINVIAYNIIMILCEIIIYVITLIPAEMDIISRVLAWKQHTTRIRRTTCCIRLDDAQDDDDDDDNNMNNILYTDSIPPPHHNMYSV